MKGLRHEAGDHVELAGDLGADLPIGGEPVGGAQAVVEHQVEFELARRVLMIALDHVQAHAREYSITRMNTGRRDSNWSM